MPVYPNMTLVANELSHRLTEANAVSFDLKVDPKKDDSASFTTMVCVLEGNKTVRQLLEDVPVPCKVRDYMVPLTRS